MDEAIERKDWDNILKEWPIHQQRVSEFLDYFATHYTGWAELSRAFLSACGAIWRLPLWVLSAYSMARNALPSGGGECVRYGLFLG